MSYLVQLTRSAERDLAAMGRADQERIVERLQRLAEAPQGRGTKSLSGELRGLRSLRVGRMRVCYDLDEHTRTVTVVEIGYRGDVYQRTRRRHGE